MSATITSVRGSPLLQRALPSLIVLGVIVGWEALVELNGLAPIYLPAPSSILRYLWVMLADGSMEYNLGITFLRIMAGFLVAAISGVIVGVVMGMSPLAARIVDPWIAALYPLPKISLITLLIIWLGTGETYKIFISAISAFFPIVISSYSGIGQVDQGLLKAAKDLGASQVQVQTKIVIPAAMPSIIAGLHLGMGVTVILVVAAEMIGGSSQSGMGYLLVNAGQVMETEKVFASLIVLAVFGAALTYAQRWVDRIIAPWAQGKV